MTIRVVTFSMLLVPFIAAVLRASGNTGRQIRRQFRAVLAMCVVIGSISCNRSPTSPSLLRARPPSQPPPPTTAPAPPALANVSGILWIHEPGEARRHAGANVYGWVETGRSGGPAGRAVTDSEGRYQFGAVIGSRIRLFVAYSEYQPCAATVEVTGDVTRDLHVVRDPEQLGARLPPSLLSQSPTLSGVVFEMTSEGRRVLSDVYVTLDGTGGGDVVTASTLTDSDGRYVLCGLEHEPHASLFVSKPGYSSLSKSVMLSGHATVLDIQLQGFPRIRE